MGKKQKKIQVVVMAHDSMEVLLLQTNQERGAFWQHITGSVEENESYEEAALREFGEETSLPWGQKDQKIDLKFIFAFVSARGKEITEKCFLFLLDKKPENIVLDPHEHDRCSWKKLESLTVSDYGHLSSYQVLERVRAYFANI